MKRLLPVVMLLLCCGFGVHKFYVSTTQIHFSKDKKRLELSLRLFSDDINLAVSQKFKTSTQLDGNSLRPQDVKLLENYLKANIAITVDGKPKTFVLANQEIEDNVVVCYLRVDAVPRLRHIQLRNSSLFELYPEQQHIVNGEVGGVRKTIVLTKDKPLGKLSWD